MLRRGIIVRRSRAADWARLAGGLALPVLVLGVIGMRIGVVPPVALQPVLVTGFALSVAALGLAAFSLVDIWNSGAAGARSAVIGALYASPALAILAIVAAAAIVYPRIADVETDSDDPILFTSAGAPAGPPEARSVALQRDAYPLIASHVYVQSLGEVHAATLKIFDDNGWRVTRDDRPAVMPMPDSDATSAMLVPEDDELVKALAAKRVMTQSRSGASTETLPAPPSSAPSPQIVTPDEPDAAAEGEVATLEAIARFPVLGFADDVVVRLRMTPDGTQVDMRSASRIGPHDLGQNARRIRSFFAALDVILQPELAGAGVASAKP